ncbi:MAG: chromosome segregation protein SMC, partial [candidate division Zixibacteria bacterium]|nr:chromosome segregation protein SMC [candidate division Zixibacteria bacterium]
MRLSELELFGFKSFPKKTRVSFEQGITSIVGPNGCGKSNIVDAIRWALGEQSAKSLRGDKMDSVIFSGGSNKNPASLAEVSLIVENGQHSETGNGNKTEKTKVTRRLYRNGDSEYLLNGVPCLLRDVTELFADTGIGASAYSVMEQAMVEALISDRTENRREIMDEAAGITKYKFRRRLTARKLENTETDLVRISDLVSEVRKQVGSLKRQMRKAEGYQKLKQELKEVELKVSRKQLTDIKQKLETLEVSLKEQSDSAISGDTELSKLDAELEKLKLEHLEVERAIGKVRSELDQLGQNIFQKQEGISIARQKTEHLKGNLARLQNEITLDTERLESFQETVVSRKSESEEVKRRLESSISENQKHQSEVKKMQSKVDSSRLVLEETAVLQTQIIIEEEQKKNLLANLSEFIQKHNSRESELLGSFDEDRARLDKFKMDLNSAQREKSAEDENLQKLQTRKENLLNEIRTAEKSVAELQAEVGQVQSRLASENSRREVLKQLWESYEGFQNGVQALIAQRQQYDIVDTVANLLKTEKVYRIAVEAALGEKAHYLVGKDKQQVFRAMELLKQRDWGEAGFILTEQKGKSTGSESIRNLNLPKGLVPLSSLVSTKDGKDGFVSLLFSKIYLAENSRMAMDVLPEVPSDIIIVTPQGELYSSLGIFKGGARKEAELVGREEQVQEAFRAIQKMEKELQEKSERLAVQIKQLETSKTELEQLYAQIESASSLLREREIR